MTVSTDLERLATSIYKRYQNIEATTGVWPQVAMELRANEALVGFSHLDGSDPVDVFEAWQATPAAEHLVLVTVAECELADGRIVPVRIALVVDRAGEAAMATTRGVGLLEAMSTRLYAAMVSAFNRTDELHRVLAEITGGAA
jgi:hypothetical protein